MRLGKIRGCRGFTLTELLVVMVIIGLLATIILPVYVTRMEDARIRLARAECMEIAMAEEQCAALHGYYVPFQLLDDAPKDESFSFGDRIDLEPHSNIYLINPLIRPVEMDNTQGSYMMNSDLQRIRDMREHWQGPFLTYQRVYDVPNDDVYGTPEWNRGADSRLDFPLDPWGEPYRFYSPLGIIGSSASQTDGIYSNIGFSDGQMTTTDDRDFPRYAVVSWGRDSRPDTSTTDKNDVIYFFGVPGVESQFGMRF